MFERIHFKIEKLSLEVWGRLLGRRIGAYWYRGTKNFGDLLTRDLLRAVGVVPVHQPMASADLVGIGSVLQSMPEAYSGIIAGSGLIRPLAKRFPNATILGVRGRYTRDFLGLDHHTFLGDPGLISDSLITRRNPTRYRLGVIPHYADKSDPRLQAWRRTFGADALFIDVARDPRKVLLDITSCAGVVSSSLHGLICADSLGVANKWMFLSEKVVGKGFKFHDYWSSLDIERMPLIPSGSETLTEVVAPCVRIVVA